MSIWILYLLCNVLCISCNVKGSCDLTSADAEGPYYSDDPPIRDDFSSMDPHALPLFISGQVIDDSSCSGVFAMIDFWSANSSGHYDNDGYNMRGAFYTDMDGYYSLNTRMPGYFTPRPEHIHAKLWLPTEISYVNDTLVVHDVEHILTTQIYFKDYLHSASDPERQATLIRDNTTGGFITTFDFIIDAYQFTSTMASASATEITPDSDETTGSEDGSSSTEFETIESTKESATGEPMVTEEQNSKGFVNTGVSKVIAVGLIFLFVLYNSNCY